MRKECVLIISIVLKPYEYRAFEKIFCKAKSSVKKEYCRRYNSDNNPPIYAYIVFTRDKTGRINNIKLQLLDVNANQIEYFTLYKKLKLHKSA